MIFQTNPQLDLAFNYVRDTHKNVFLTGKAGTGKTTFLHELKKSSPKRMVIVAPTGVAAINAGGVTIHSFFQIPFGPYLPNNGQDAAPQRRFSGEKLALIQSLDLLVIDEISMVRADLLDSIDEVLRRYKARNKPFGGVQLLMIGDLHQLPPIVKDEEWAMLQPYYKTAYFFGSNSLQQTDPITIELTHIYRQADRTFIDLLNKVRENEIDAGVLTQLNSRYQPNFQPTEAEPYITLTSHNSTANLTNGEKLNSLKTPLHSFEAVVTGDFPTLSYPTDLALNLKEGAQVMFVKNDNSFEKLYYNGKLGRITKLSKEAIVVECPDNTRITVLRTEWQNLKYTLSAETKEISEDVIGTFTQFPLKLAWAITIHKSQGLTFERAIIDAGAAFAHGQVYVALSRCKSFEGIVLRSPLESSSIRTDRVVHGYSAEAAQNRPTEGDLNASKIVFQQQLLQELFDFKRVKSLFTHANQVLLGNENTLPKPTISKFKMLFSDAETHIFAVATKFIPHLNWFLAQDGLPEQHDELQARVKKAAAYFNTKLNKNLYEPLNALSIESDNKSVLKSAKDAMDSLKQAVFTKYKCFHALENGFVATNYIRAKNDAELDFFLAQTTKKAKPTTSANTPQAELRNRLKNWRDEKATEINTELYMVLATKTIDELIERLPTSLGELALIKGFGKMKLKQFGSDIVTIIADFCADFGITKNEFSFGAPKTPPPPPKIDTKQVSLDLFKAGKSIAEIAAARSLVASTIEGHLAHFVGTGELRVSKLLSATAIRDLTDFFAKKTQPSSAEAFTHFGGKYSYSDLRVFLNHLKFEGNGA